MKPSELTKALQLMHMARMPTYVEGKPGIGKSAIFKQFAEQSKLQFLDIRLAYFDPVDMRGLPFPKGDKTTWLTPDFLPAEGEGIILLDEFSAAPQAMQLIAYQLCLDRRIGDYQLPDGWSVHLAGNSQGDRAIANRLSSAIVSRVAKYTLEVSLDDWIDYALSVGVEYQILAFLRFRPALLHNFDPKTWKDGESYSCPRSWEKLSKIMAIQPKLTHQIMGGIVGEGAATEFFSFLDLCHKLPDLDAIIANPGKAKMPEGPAACYAVASGLARKITLTNFPQVLIYLERISKELKAKEYEIMAVYDANILLRKPDSSLLGTKAGVEWSIKNNKILAG